jgi:hypothetical protein
MEYAAGYYVETRAWMRGALELERGQFYITEPEWKEKTKNWIVTISTPLVTR